MAKFDEIRRREKPVDRWWKLTEGDEQTTCDPDLREGFPCPSCLLGELHYNGLFQLRCDNCGLVAEAGVFT